MDYVSYSKNAFLKLKDIYKEQGFALYQPKDDENIVMYATREGLVHVWQNNEGFVSINCITLFEPSAIVRGIFEELEKIAKRKHWRDGVHKLHHYLRHIGEEQLDQEGLDPYFYAWMVHYDVQLNTLIPRVSESNYFDHFDDILRLSEFHGIVAVADTIGANAEQLAYEYTEKRENDGVDYDTFVDSKIKGSRRYQRARDLVDKELPHNASEETRDNLALNICQLISNTEDAVNAQG